MKVNLINSIFDPAGYKSEQYREVLYSHITLSDSY